MFKHRHKSLAKYIQNRLNKVLVENGLRKKLNIGTLGAVGCLNLPEGREPKEEEDVFVCMHSTYILSVRTHLVSCDCHQSPQPPLKFDPHLNVVITASRG